MDPENCDKTLYHAYLFKNPGFKRWIRHKTHGWGVSTLNGIIEKDIKDDLKNKLLETKTKAKHLKDVAKEKVVDKSEKVKEKIVDSREKIKHKLHLDSSTQCPEKQTTSPKQQ